jgi:hypothetical protein
MCAASMCFHPTVAVWSTQCVFVAQGPHKLPVVSHTVPGSQDGFSFIRMASMKPVHATFAAYPLTMSPAEAAGCAFAEDDNRAIRTRTFFCRSCGWHAGVQVSGPASAMRQACVHDMRAHTLWCGWFASATWLSSATPNRRSLSRYRSEHAARRGAVTRLQSLVMPAKLTDLGHLGHGTQRVVHNVGVPRMRLESGDEPGQRAQPHESILVLVCAALRQLVDRTLRSSAGTVEGEVEQRVAGQLTEAHRAAEPVHSLHDGLDASQLPDPALDYVCSRM